MKCRCGFYSKLVYCEGVVEEFEWEVGELGGKLPPSPQYIDVNHIHMCISTISLQQCLVLNLSMD